MNESLDHVLVPYSRFLECQDRRQRFAAELMRPEQPPADDADGVQVPVRMAPDQSLTGVENS